MGAGLRSSDRRRLRAATASRTRSSSGTATTARVLVQSWDERRLAQRTLGLAWTLGYDEIIAGDWDGDGRVTTPSRGTVTPASSSSSPGTTTHRRSATRHVDRRATTRSSPATWTATAASTTCSSGIIDRGPGSSRASPPSGRRTATTAAGRRATTRSSSATGAPAVTWTRCSSGIAQTGLWVLQSWVELPQHLPPQRLLEHDLRHRRPRRLRPRRPRRRPVPLRHRDPGAGRSTRSTGSSPPVVSPEHGTPATTPSASERSSTEPLEAFPSFARRGG